jgi:hypothetical protein
MFKLTCVQEYWVFNTKNRHLPRSTNHPYKSIQIHRSTIARPRNLEPTLSIQRDRSALELERRLSHAHSNLVRASSGGRVDFLRVVARRDGQLTSLGEQRDNEDSVLERVDTVELAARLERGAVPVDEFVFSNRRCFCARFEGGDEGCSWCNVSFTLQGGGGRKKRTHIEPAVMRHVGRPCLRHRIVVFARRSTDVVRLAVVVPGDYLDEAGAEGEDLVPAAEPEEVAGEDPCLGGIVGEEPR